MANFFISYSRKDQSAAEIIQASLELMGYTCWRDTSDILAGLKFTEEIRRSIDSTSIFLPLISSAFQNSQMCMRELKYARNEEKYILPLVINGIIPESLKSTHYLRLSCGEGGEVAASELLSMLHHIRKFVGKPDEVDQNFSNDSSFEWPEDDLEQKLTNTTWSWCDNENYVGDKWIEFRPAHRAIRSWLRDKPQAWKVTKNGFFVFGKHVLQFNFEENTFQGSLAIPLESNVERSGRLLRSFGDDDDLP